jgi:NAD-dependent dihydropyrimidine dehydrogenase PreA subunit
VSAERKPPAQPAQAARECGEASGRVAPVVDRNRCEGEAACARLCPYGVFEIRVLAASDRAVLSLRGRLKAWAHGWKQAYVANPASCHACRLCVQSCPEQALALQPYEESRRCATRLQN